LLARDELRKIVGLLLAKPETFFEKRHTILAAKRREFRNY